MKIFLTIILLILLSSCNEEVKEANYCIADQKFRKMCEEWYRAEYQHLCCLNNKTYINFLLQKNTK